MSIRDVDIEGKFLERLANGAGTYQERVAEKIGSADVSLAFGQPVHQDGVTVIPVSRTLWGFGAGSGLGKPKEKNGEGIQSQTVGELGLGTGGGGGVAITPIGYIEIVQSRARYRPVFRVSELLLLTITGGIIVVLINIVAPLVRLWLKASGANWSALR